MENVNAHVLLRKHFLLYKTARVSYSWHILNDIFILKIVNSLPFQEPEYCGHMYKLSTFGTLFY